MREPCAKTVATISRHPMMQLAKIEQISKKRTDSTDSRTSSTAGFIYMVC